THAPPIANNGDFGHDRNPHVATEFVEYQEPGGPHQFQHRGPLERFLKHRVDAVSGEAHGILSAAADAVDHTTAVRARAASGFHDGLGIGPSPQRQHTGFELLPPQAVLGIRRDRHRLDAELPEAVCDYGMGNIIKADQCGAGSGFARTGRGCERSSESFIHVGEDSTFDCHCTSDRAVCKVPKGQPAAREGSLPKMRSREKGHYEEKAAPNQGFLPEQERSPETSCSSGGTAARRSFRQNRTNSTWRIRSWLFGPGWAPGPSRQRPGRDFRD